MSARPQSQLQARVTQFGGRAALIVIAVGLLVIGLGYNGIAGASINNVVDLRAQLPYLLSGGVFGLSLVIVGAALMITQGAREDRVRLEAKLDQLLEAQVGRGESVAAGVPSNVDGLYAAGTASFHLPECRLVDGREETSYVTAEEAASRGLAPCRVCRPAPSAPGISIS
jgi:hypothetical protein